MNPDFWKTAEELKLMNNQEVDKFCFHHGQTLGHQLRSVKKTTVDGRKINGYWQCSCGKRIDLEWI